MGRNFIIFFGVLLIGCGTFAPVIGASDESEPSTRSPLEIRAVEGRLGTLVLSVSTDEDPPVGAVLEFYRSDASSDYELQQAVELDASLSEALLRGIQWRDEKLGPGNYSYVAVLVSDDRATESRPFEVSWTPPPAKPEILDIRPLSARTTELSWPAASQATVIFRRDVLNPEASIERIADLPPRSTSRFVDGGLTPGGVYAYRIARGIEAGDIVHFGPPGEEVYVTLPSEEQTHESR